MVDEIKSAHDAADQLPQDLQSLHEARIKLDESLKSSVKAEAAIQLKLESSTLIDENLKLLQNEAEQTIERCRAAYRNATSVGLAASFEERRKSLTTSMWIWLSLLIGALIVGSAVGAEHMNQLIRLISNPETASTLIASNLLLTLLSVARQFG